MEKVRAIFVWAPLGAHTSHLPHSANELKGLQHVPSQDPMHQCYTIENVQEQGSNIYPFQASQLALGYTAATFHWIGHFATGCLKLGGSHWLPVLDTPTRLLDAHFLAFGHALMYACEHAPCLCCRVSMALLLELPTHRAAVFLQICPKP